MGDIIIEKENYRMFVVTLANFILLLAAVAVVVYGAIYTKHLYKYGGLVVSIVLLLQFICNFIKTKSSKPLLVIAREGVTDASGKAPFYIPYIDIEKFVITNIFGSRGIGVIPKDCHEFILKLSPMHQRMAKERMRMQLPPFFISVQLAKDMTVEDIYSLLEKRLGDYSRLYD